MGKTLVIRPVAPAERAVREMIAELDAYQEALYPPESNHLEPASTLAAESFYLAAAYLYGRPAGMGAFKRAGGAYVEIKRLYVRSWYRRQGLASALLNHLHEKAFAEGYTLAMLETGVHQEAALNLYTKLGYRVCPPFGSYVSDPLSVFMRRALP